MSAEDQFIAQLIATPPPISAPCPIGDDCCWWQPQGLTCLSVDSIVEDRHFTRADSPEAIGAKAAGAALSDLAAMGARPVGAVVALHIAPGWDAPALVAACRRHLAAYGCPLLGGDTTAASALALSVTVWGEASAGRLVHRHGGQAGDVLAVTGPLGGAPASGRHLRPRPLLEEGCWCAAQPAVHAMMDLSDGLASDAPRLAVASGLGCELEAAAIPLHPDIADDPEALRRACCDGEDFALLLAIDPAAWPELYRAWPFAPLHAVGRLITEPGAWWCVDGSRQALPWRGYEHRW